MGLPPPVKKLAYNCSTACSLRVEVIGEELALFLKDLRENGTGMDKMTRLFNERTGRNVSKNTMARHVKHYRDVVEDESVDPILTEKPGDIEILDAIVAAGYRNSRNWKPTIRDTLDAMKLKSQMTGQSAFEDMLAAMDEALMAVEAPEAEKSAEERSQEGEEE